MHCFGPVCSDPASRLPVRKYMPSRWPRDQRRRATRFARQFAIIGMVVCYSLVMFGVPLPESVSDRDTGQPFPCQDHRCGCDSAEQCWQSCCCFTLGQRLAWARRNDVTPPEFVVRRVGLREREQIASPALGENCCSQNAGASETSVGRHGSEESTSDRTQHANCSNVDLSVDKSKRRMHFVISIRSLKCRGLGTSWAQIGDFVPTGPQSLGQFDPLLVGTVVILGCQLDDIAFPPPLPPPRA